MHDSTPLFDSPSSSNSSHFLIDDRNITIIATTPPLHTQMQAEMNGSWEVPISISLTPKIMLHLSFLPFFWFFSWNEQHEGENQPSKPVKRNKIEKTCMNKPYLNWMQIWDVCGHRPVDYAATRGTTQCNYLEGSSWRSCKHLVCI